MTENLGWGLTVIGILILGIIGLLPDLKQAVKEINESTKFQNSDDKNSKPK